MSTVKYYSWVKLVYQLSKLGYEFGVQSGNMNGRVERSNNGHLHFIFTFEGTDEMGPVHGFGTATLVEDNTLEGELRYHMSDTYRFIWKRIK